MSKHWLEYLHTSLLSSVSSGLFSIVCQTCIVNAYKIKLTQKVHFPFPCNCRSEQNIQYYGIKPTLYVIHIILSITINNYHSFNIN